MESNEERDALAKSFDRHVEEEGKILGEYRTLAEKLGNGSVGFLIDLILTEEELHHLLLRTMAKWLREPPKAEELTDSKEVNRDEILRQTRKLLEHEQETIDACGSLSSRLADEDQDLLVSLLDAMILDSRKHHTLLSAVEKMIKSGAI
jgi:hypothetical protein